MSEPFKGQPPDKTEEKTPEKTERREETRESQPVNVQDLEIRRGIPGQQFRADPSVDVTLAKLDLTFFTGANPGMQSASDRTRVPLRKAEEKPIELAPHMTVYKPRIDEFLKTTDIQIDKKPLTDAERRQLHRSRESLSNANNLQDAVSDALHLARLYQHMRYIEEAKKAIDLSLGIDPNHHYGKQLFRELERMHPADVGASAPPVAANPLTKSNLRKRILSLTGGRVIVVGDLLIDELLEGKPERISREAPILVLEHVDTELILGGGANTAHNIAAMGGVCHAVGICGDDEYARRLEALFEKAHITHGLVRDSSRPTTVKTRILSKSHSFKQQLLRLDRICHEKIDPDIEHQVIEKVRGAAGNYSALVLSDYRAGIMTDPLIRACRAIAAEQKLYLIVDAQDDFARYQNVSLLTPNQPDTEKALGYLLDSEENLTRAGEDLLLMTGAEALLITRGAEGLVLFQQKEQMVLLPPFNQSEVFDVTGAGDTVVAAMALALVTGSTYLEAMALGNLAAGVVVKKPGTAVTNQKELLESLDALKIEE